MENKSVDYGVIEELKSIWSNTFPEGIHTQPILRLFSVICESIFPLRLFFFSFIQNYPTATLHWILLYHFTVCLCLSLKCWLSLLTLQPWVHEKRRLTKCPDDVLTPRDSGWINSKKNGSWGCGAAGGGGGESELSSSARRQRTQRSLHPISHFIGTLLWENSINSLVKLTLNLHTRSNVY